MRLTSAQATPFTQAVRHHIIIEKNQNNARSAARVGPGNFSPARGVPSAYRPYRSTSISSTTRAGFRFFFCCCCCFVVGVMPRPPSPRCCCRCCCLTALEDLPIPASRSISSTSGRLFQGHFQDDTDWFLSIPFVFA